MYSLRVCYKASVYENEIYDLRDIFRFFCFIFHEFPPPSIALHSIPTSLNIQQTLLVCRLNNDDGFHERHNTIWKKIMYNIS